MRASASHFLLVAVLFLVQSATRAQNSSSTLSRRATSHGSFPVYIGVSLSKVGSNVREFQRITALNGLPASFENAGGRFRTFGMGVKLGFIFARGEPYFSRTLSIPNILLELDMNNYVFNLPSKDGGTLLLNLTSGSVRTGVRWNVYYPLVLQFTAGPILFNRSSIFLNRTGRREDAIRAASEQGLAPVGIEYRIRASFFDPSGSSGGIGAYFEYQATDFFLKPTRNQQPLYAAVGAEERTGRPVIDYRAWQVGVIIPLALPFR